DGSSPIERILRLSKIERLKGLDFLASLARSGHIDLPVTTVAEPDTLSIPSLSSRSQTRPKAGSTPPPPTQDASLEPLDEAVQAASSEYGTPEPPPAAVGPPTPALES